LGGRQIVILFVDYRIALTDKHHSLSAKVAELKEVIHKSYARWGSPQEEVWVIAHPVVRHA
jgi:hypothetical protein